MNGSRYERLLCRHLNNNGYHVVRSPASGGRTTRELPDVHYSKPGTQSTAVELKASSDSKAYYSPEEVKALISFSEAFNARPRLGARFKGDTSFYLAIPEECRQTDAGTYVLDSGTPVDTTIKP